MSESVLKTRREQRHLALSRQNRGKKTLEHFLAEYEVAMAHNRLCAFNKAIQARGDLSLLHEEFDGFIEECLNNEVKRRQKWDGELERHRQNDSQGSATPTGDDDGADAGVDEVAVAAAAVANTGGAADAREGSQDGENDTQDALAGLLSETC